jgi:tetratricopeptide (TPR) repeat protein
VNGNRHRSAGTIPGARVGLIHLHRINGDDASARQTWSAGLAQAPTDTSEVSNARRQAWIANLHAALGDTQSALHTTNELAQAHPTNGYIHYRLCHVLAEIGYLDDAVKMLGSAVDHGFLSTQLLRQEELLALAPLRHLDEYAAVTRWLDTNVERCRRTYASHLPTSSGEPDNTRYGDVR